jgi:hypothetical protein
MEGRGKQSYFLSLHDYMMRLFMAVPMIPSAALSDFGGRKYRRFCSVQLSPILAAPLLYGVPVFVSRGLRICTQNKPLSSHSTFY